MTNKTVYKSKYAWWMVAIIIAIILIYPVLMLACGFEWSLLVTGIAVATFCLDLMVNTSYTIHNDKLRLKAGCIFRATIDIKKIVSITHKRTIINANSFAWSNDRLIIKMPRSIYMVSPADEQGFIDRLLKINPQIKTK